MHSNLKNHPLYKLTIQQHVGWRKTLPTLPSPMPTVIFPGLFCSSISQHCLCYLFPYLKIIQCAFEFSAIFGITLNNSPDNCTIRPHTHTLLPMKLWRLKALSNLALHTVRAGASTALLGNLCQHISTLTLKKKLIPASGQSWLRNYSGLQQDSNLKRRQAPYLGQRQEREEFPPPPLIPYLCLIHLVR